MDHKPQDDLSVPEQVPITQPVPAFGGITEPIPEVLPYPTAPKKSKTWLWILLGVGGFFVLGIIVLAVGLIVYSSTDERSVSSTLTENKTSTPCYTLDTTGLKSTTGECDLTTLLDNEGYFPGIEIFQYQLNSYGTFKAFISQYEADLRADPELVNITVRDATVDGMTAVRIEYQRAKSSNVTELYIGAEEGFTPTYYEVWVDVEDKLAYTPPKNGGIKSFSIKGDNTTKSTEQTFNNGLTSLKFIRK